MNTAVNQMDQVTQQNAAMVEQTTAASHSLAHETAELVALTGRFKIGNAAPVRAVSSVIPLRRPNKGAPGRPAKAPVLKVVAQRGEPARSAAPAKDEGWEEF